MFNFFNWDSKTENAILDLQLDGDDYSFSYDIKTAFERAKAKDEWISETIRENEDTIKKLTPECDKLDYILASCSGILCGMFDIFLVGKPGDSKLMDTSDKWIKDSVDKFARMNGWDEKKSKSSIRYLEKKYKVPYDQRGAGDAGKNVFGLSPKDHHFKSLGHNPTLCGLFFSILDQFTNESHFIADGQLIGLQDADDGFRLQGTNVPSKIFCGFTNWLGHLFSDVAGSSSSKKRGMGLPSPFWCWINDLCVIKRKFGIPEDKFEKDFYNVALEIYKKGFDLRYTAAQSGPVILNEVVTRTMYSTRRLIQYYIKNKQSETDYTELWKTCEPFTNATVKRMLTISHGTFMLIDVTDAAIRSKAGKPCDFVMRVNIVGVTRFAISLGGEFNRLEKRKNLELETTLLKREKIILDDYINTLNELSDKYDDELLISFISQFEKSNMYKVAFESSVQLAMKRNVSGNVLKTKKDIDDYFRGEQHDD